MLVGRDEETARIDRLLAGVRQGRSGALVVRGDIGIGKTSLLEYARHAATAAGMTILATTGVESEAELAYSGLHALFHRVLDRVDDLPDAQATALRIALGHGPGEPADPYLIGLGVLSLLSDLAGDAPLVCLVDDLPWLDHASRVALLFAARRLEAEGAGMLFAARDDTSGAGPDDGAMAVTGIAELRLPALGPDAAELVPEVRTLPDPVRRKVIADAHGNPLALVELAAVASDDDTGARFGPVPVRPLPAAGRVQATFAARIAALPEPTRAVLRIAAAEDTGELSVVLAAARRLGARLTDLAAAERSGLVRVEGASLRFRHPLIRSAAYHDATLVDRLAAHRALADVLTGPRDADRRAWHLASATSAPDDEAAEALADAADRALRVGGPAAAAAAYELAARLTLDPARRGDRLARAATALVDTSRWERAVELADEAAPLTRDPAIRTSLASTRLVWLVKQDRIAEGAEEALLAAEAVAASDPALAALTFYKVASILWNHCCTTELGPVVTRLDALGLPSTPDTDPYVSGTRGLADLVADRLDRGVPEIRALSAGLRAGAGNATLWDRTMMCGWGLLAGDVEGVHRDVLGLVREARDRGALAPLCFALSQLARLQLLHGQPRAALATCAQMTAIDDDSAVSVQSISGARLHIQARAAAILGDEADCARAAAELAATDTDDAGGQLGTAHVLALLDLGSGRFEDALRRLEDATAGRYRHLVIARYALPDLVEAAVRAGVPERGRAAAERYAAWAKATGETWSAAVALCLEAMLLPADRAEEATRLYERSIALGALPFPAARIRLLYGEHLRRARRRSDARTPLAAALEAFERMGARSWADRARSELRATGQHVAPARTGVRPADRLTPQELQVARLAASGLSNRDIGAQLFLSPRTVGYHLYKLFPKLGVTSRTALASLDLDD